MGSLTKQEKEDMHHLQAAAIENHQTAMNKKAMQKHSMAALHVERREAETERLIARAKESQGWRSGELEQEELLAHELDKDKRQMFVEYKRRQQMLETPELRSVQNELKKAYATKELMVQLSENKLKNVMDKVIEAHYLRDKEKNENYFKELHQKVREEEERKKKAYREVLQDQMINKHKRKQEEYIQYLEEKALIDAAVKVIVEEDEMEEEARQALKQKTREEKELFWKAREYWLMKEKEAQELEDKRVREYLEDKFKKEQELQEQNRIKEEKFIRKKEAVAKILSDISEKSSEKEIIRSFLANEEKRAKEEEKEKNELEKKLRQKFEFKEIFAKHLEDHMEKLEEQKRREIEEGKHMLAHFIEESRLDQLTKEKRRRMELDYRMQLKEDIEKRHRDRIFKAQEECQMLKLQEEARLERRRLIEEERLRLLQEHAGKLVGFLPKGILRESDLAHLSSEVQQFYGHKQQETLAET